MDKVRVAVIGLGFGGEFVPIYQAWDKTECVAVCRRDPDKLRGFADSFGIEQRYTDYRDLLQDPDIDAVHINTDLNSHARIAIEALKAGKHVASTVTMGLTREECREIVRLEQETGLVYMMMETAVYTREFLYVKKLYEAGEMGRLQFLRGSHQQNMSLPGWPPTGMDCPHVVPHPRGILSGILRRPVTGALHRIGPHQPGLRQELRLPLRGGERPFEIRDSDVTGEITLAPSSIPSANTGNPSRLLRHEKSFEWEQCIGEHPVLFSGFEDAVRIEVPDTDHMLPPQIARFALKNQIIDDQHVSFLQGDGHGGSHPHMVLEWISAILEGRKAHISARVAANWTVTGLVAHESAMQGGAILDMPEWALF